MARNNGDGSWSYYNLISSYNKKAIGNILDKNNDLTIIPISLYYTGLFSYELGARINRSYNAFYRLSRISSNLNSFRLTFDSTGFYPQDINGKKGDGLSLRRVAKLSFIFY